MSGHSDSHRHSNHHNKNLYHVKRVVHRPSPDPRGTKPNVLICGTYTFLPGARQAALRALANEGYTPDLFETYHSRQEPEWIHEDGVVVEAKALSGEVFMVLIETEPNSLGLVSDNDGMVTGTLYYVIRTVIDYYNDRSGNKWETFVEGTFRDGVAAEKAARSCLLDANVSRESFTEYDVNNEKEGRLWDDDVVVHAVAANGTNYLVSIQEKSL
ncbi:hypothetical protein M8818_001871 [Zalaria obscura]|uniref:Uncharacterized protein n=1 Tax=Zalaria obscura TaxID=2024903 RepID=A0ACC3SJK3_9PEZI